MSALSLRILACVCMLLDHIGYCLPRLEALRWVGRLAFPLYVFLLVNGYRHTANRLRYALRLALFAALSQIPFSLFCHDRLLTPHMNVFFTLLLALLCIWSADGLRQALRRLPAALAEAISLLPALAVFALFFFGAMRADYGARGILLAVVFWRFPTRRLAMGVGMFAAVFHGELYRYLLQLPRMLLGRTPDFSLPPRWSLVQAFSLLALLPIFLYNGSRGALPRSRCAARAVQLGFYAFYPLHLLALHFLLQ